MHPSSREMANAPFVIRSNLPSKKTLVMNVRPSTSNLGVSSSPSLPAHPLTVGIDGDGHWSAGGSMSIVKPWYVRS